MEMTKKEEKKSEWEWKRVRVTYYIPTLWLSPANSPKFSIEYSYLDSLKAVGEYYHYVGGTKWCVFKVEQID